MANATQHPAPPARFFWQAEQDELKTQLAGRAVFEDRPFIEIWTPGDATNIIRRPVREGDKSDYPREWADFQNSKEQRATGTPLDELAFLTEAQRLEFKAVRIHTAEQLVAMPDSVAQQFAGINGIKRRVQGYLDAAAGNAPMLKLQAELDARDAQLAAQGQQLKELSEMVSELRKAKKG